MFGANEDTPLRAALYPRVSSDEQKEGENILTQIEMGRKYCKALNLNLVAVFDQDDGVSGTIPLGERPGGKLLLEAAREKRFDIVLIYNVKRLARKLSVMMDAWAEFEKLGINVRSMTEGFDTSTPFGRMVMQMMGIFAELDRENILEQTRDGRENVIRRGYWPGGQPPLGYRIQHTENARKGARRGVLVEQKDEADIIRLIFRLYTQDGMYLQKLADHLTAQNIPTSATIRNRKLSDHATTGNGAALQNKGWTINQVYRIIRNPVYYGKPLYYREYNAQNREPIEGTAPAIIDEDTWKTAQAKLKTNFRVSKRNMKRPYLLRGLVRCGMCGYSCTGRGLQKGPRYYCHPGKGKCTGVNVRADQLEAQIWEDIRYYVYHPGETAQLVADQIAQERDETDTVMQEIAKLDEAMRNIQKQRQWVIDQGKRNHISQDEAEQSLKESSAELEMLRARRREFEGQAEYHKSRTDYVAQTERMLADLRESVDNADEDTKEWAVQLMVEKVAVTPLEDGRQIKVEPYYRFPHLEGMSTDLRVCP